MRVNENVVAALRSAAVEAGQPKEVAQRLVAWLDALATGNADADDQNEAARRVSDLVDQISLSEDEDELEELLEEDA